MTTRMSAEGCFFLSMAGIVDGMLLYSRRGCIGCIDRETLSGRVLEIGPSRPCVCPKHLLPSVGVQRVKLGLGAMDADSLMSASPCENPPGLWSCQSLGGRYL